MNRLSCSTRSHTLRTVVALCVAAAVGIGIGACTSSTTSSGTASSSVSSAQTSAPAASASATESGSASASVSGSASATSSTSTRGLAATVPGFDEHAHSLTREGSLWQILNKAHPFANRRYVPKDLVVTKLTNGKQFRADAAAALATMDTAATRAGARFTVVSAYRSYTYQRSLYNRYKAQHGKQAADRFSARPGFSEHQTGLATDLGSPDGKCTLENCFAQTTAGKWLYHNSWKYGFILRYTKGQTATTGYMYEAWHFRYLGTDASRAYHESGAKTLEQFFGVTGGTTYAQ